jgi:hypothetical protein
VRRPVLLPVLALLAGASVLSAQGVAVSAAALLESDLASQLSLGYELRPLGPVRLSLGALRLGASNGDRWGAGFDLGLRLGQRIRLYPVAGVAAGWGTGSAEGTWGGWSAGLGYEVLRGGGFGLAFEGRYLRLSNPGDALALALRASYRFGRPASPPAPSPALSIAPGSSVLAAEVVQSAMDLMGSPYVWGGTDANGFDCSGLIQYAFGRHGVSLPRTSRDQATSGNEVTRDPGALLPGDILTFAEQGSRITHVGLYVGDGQFIHSSSRGVRVSRLRPDDPDGAYWWRRWQGARRVLPAG